jgi:hypothetical protein
MRGRKGVIAYLVNKWAFARRFEQQGGQYLYKRMPGGPVVPMSEEERRDCLRLYRRRY